jgi:hypothetical protein
LIFDPVKLLVVLVAIADSWFNFRQRWSKGPGTGMKQRDEHDQRDDRDD